MLLTLLIDLFITSWLFLFLYCNMQIYIFELFQRPDLFLFPPVLVETLTLPAEEKMAATTVDRESEPGYVRSVNQYGHHSGQGVRTWLCQVS